MLIQHFWVQNHMRLIPSVEWTGCGPETEPRSLSNHHLSTGPFKNEVVTIDETVRRSRLASSRDEKNDKALKSKDTRSNGIRAHKGTRLIPTDHDPTQLRVPLCGRPMIKISSHAVYGI
ncbi:hypothetical protein OSB04_005228 [Centaurea solstitialis]|uniref:Uncharacterized protein n=1 Tax=Centaurea solstitialis TaxID=347529 RepID=A0AA38TFL1_9ASTR|nr:hypothetical protein OSB04_005228 [Centaurea solstitialis]